MAVGSQVSSFDERIKVLLAQALPRGEPVSGLAIYGFKVGDEVRVVAADNMMVKENLSINALDGDTVTFDLPFPRLPPGAHGRHCSRWMAGCAC